MDFIFDTTETGGNLKYLMVLDEFSRYLIAVEVSGSISSTRVIGIPANAMMMHGKQACLRTDNGPEFVSRAMMLWCIDNEISQSLIAPGKPIENAIVESFNGRFRDEFLYENLFLIPKDAREKLFEWRDEYNTYRLHGSLGDRTPEEAWIEMDERLNLKVG